MDQLRVILVAESEEVAVAISDRFIKEKLPKIKVFKGDLFDHQFNCVVANSSSFGLFTGSRLIKYIYFYLYFSFLP